MKLKILLQTAVVTLVVLMAGHSAMALTVLGQNPFYSTYLADEAQVKQMLESSRADVKEGLMKAGSGDLFEPLFAQLAGTEMTKVQYRKGQRFEWMFFRKKGKGRVRVDKDVVWEGNDPIDGYEFTIDSNNQRHTMTVLPVCGNLSLLGSGPIPAPPVVPAVSSGESAAGSPGTGSGSQEEAAPAAASSRLPILVDAGYLHLLDPGDMVFARIGLEYPFNESFSVIGMVGGVHKYGGRDGDNAFIADVFANYRFSRFFVGLGLGAWLSSGDDDLDSEDSDLDVILNFGARLFGDPEGFNTSLFFEVRSAVDEMDDFDLYGRVGAGLRFSF